MRIYLDMCSLQRPLDTKTQVRVAVEAEAILSIITLWESGQLELVSSSVLVFEAEQIPLSQRRTYILETLLKANLFVSSSALVEERAQRFVDLGIKPLDALHLASSIEAKADYFCTCDDRFLRRAKEADTESTKVVSPLELITEITE
ncbi:MAG: PIN domain-containing protein [Myxacorys chilensis ATA2-1-KO14]|nr:PIN domain-containing protein [Myxacorys chilensis ATA2-1-KO14]